MGFKDYLDDPETVLSFHKFRVTRVMPNLLPLRGNDASAAHHLATVSASNQSNRGIVRNMVPVDFSIFYLSSSFIMCIKRITGSDNLSTLSLRYFGT